MKPGKTIFITFVLFFCLISCISCKDKSLPQPILQRDIYNTGGNLTFVVDENAHVATFGGEGEVIQFYEKDIAKGWHESGNRIGFSFIVPKEVKDYKSGSAKFDGQKLLPTEYIDLQEGQTLTATFQPIVKNNKREYSLKITWEEGKNEQIYHIIIAKGTLFMQEKTEQNM